MVLEAVKVALDPSPVQERLLLSHAGASRFAFNAGLAHVKEALDAGDKPEWSLYSLRKWWNSNKVTQTYSEISIEDLNAAGMVKNHHLAKAVSDAAFAEFRRQLEYKTARTSATLHVINRWYPSSKTCSKCGAVKAKLSLAERVYRCDACGLTIDRDLNAAVNILVAGSAPETINARGGTGRRNDLSGRATLDPAKCEPSRRSGNRAGLEREPARTPCKLQQSSLQRAKKGDQK